MFKGVIAIMLILFVSACSGTDGLKEGFTSKSTCYQLPAGERERCLEKYKEYEDKAVQIKNTTK